MPQADWQGPLGQLVRRLDLDPRCNCFPPVVHDPGCRFAYRTDNKRCECRLDFSLLCSHVKVGGIPLSHLEYVQFRDMHDEAKCRMPFDVWVDLLLEARTRGGISPDSLFALLTLFDPDSLTDRPEAPAPARAMTHAGRSKVMELRAARGLSPFHPMDGSVWEEGGEETQVAVQGELGRHEGDLQTPMPTEMELKLLSACEANVMPAWLTWPWGRAHAGLGAAGHALHEIKTKRLFRGKHLSFRGYLAGRWDWQGQDADRLLEAAGLQAPPTLLPFREVA